MAMKCLCSTSTKSQQARKATSSLVATTSKSKFIVLGPVFFTVKWLATPTQSLVWFSSSTCFSQDPMMERLEVGIWVISQLQESSDSIWNHQLGPVPNVSRHYS